MQLRQFKDKACGKSREALNNYARAKLLAPNLCVLVVSRCARGIEADFGEDEPKAGPAVLPLVRAG